ncbi:MAG: hypothetical protein HOQ22_04020 [Nocardioidaceae bacterium]|nr:hypothetical protein [Nocardioidaceae bacterium]NUS50192.1 hypothetical protein [Nocardioidaceae bacterium]
MSTELTIEIFEPEADAEELDRLAGDLRQELLQLDVDSVSPLAAGPAPDDSKGLELAAIGALLVHLKDSLPLVNAVVSVVRTWVQRGASRSLKVTVDGRTLELSAATADQQQQLVDEFIRSLRA